MAGSVPEDAVYGAVNHSQPWTLVQSLVEEGGRRVGWPEAQGSGTVSAEQGPQAGVSPDRSLTPAESVR